MSIKIERGSDWDLRLHATGRFALQLNKVAEVAADGTQSHSCNVCSGATLPEVFGGVLWYVKPEQLAEVHRAILGASVFQAQASVLQRDHSAKIKRAAAARRLADALAVERLEAETMQGGAA